MVPSIFGYFVLSQSANTGEIPNVVANVTIANIAMIFFETNLFNFNFSNIKDNRTNYSSMAK